MKGQLHMEDFEAVSNKPSMEFNNWQMTYDEDCLKADLTVARGAIKLLSILYEVESWDCFQESLLRCFDSMS